MSKRLTKLLNQVELDRNENAYPNIKVSNIKKRVNDALNVIPEERNVYIRRKFYKYAVVATIVILLFTSVLAATINLDILRIFFVGDSSVIQEHVQTPGESISNRQFELTLEELLTDGNHTFIIVSLRGRNNEAVQELMNADSILIPTFSFEGHFSVIVEREIFERNTSDTRYWAFWISDVGESKKMTSRFIDGQHITISAESNVETLELTFEDQPNGGVVKISISPLGLTLHRGVRHNAMDSGAGYIAFVMNDGQTISLMEMMADGVNGRTLGLFDGEFRGEEYLGRTGEYEWQQINGHFREVTPLANIKSIIVGGVEYEINTF